ncbi:MAG: hypothetical protein AAB352_03215 [Patescibacteria group bacterium]
MGIFSTRIQRLEKKGAYVLDIVKEEINDMLNSPVSDVVEKANLINGYVENVVADYPHLKAKYENDFKVLSEIAEDYYRLLSTAGYLLLMKNNDGEFSILQRKYRLGMLEIKNIKKKFEILNK